MQSRSVARIRGQAAQMRRIFAEAEGDLASRPVPRSAWCAAEHFDHTIKVAHSILALLAKPEIAAMPTGINLIGRVVLAVGWIPRGRGKSPERLRGAAVTMDELEAKLAGLEAVIESVAGRTDAPSNIPIVRHPLFGGLTHNQALRFVAIHTHHHLKIVETCLG